MKKPLFAPAVLLAAALPAHATITSIPCTQMLSDLRTESYNAVPTGSASPGVSLAAGFATTSLYGTTIDGTDALDSGVDLNALCGVDQVITVVAVGGQMDGFNIDNGIEFRHAAGMYSKQFQVRFVDQANRNVTIQSLCGSQIQDTITVSSGPAFPLPILCFESDVLVEGWRVLDAVGSNLTWCADDVGSAGFTAPSPRCSSAMAVEWDEYDAVLARARGGLVVEVGFKTLEERDTNYFVVERSDAHGTPFLPLPGGLVDARGAGFPYRFVDTSGAATSRYRIAEYTSSGRGDVTPEFPVRSVAGPSTVPAGGRARRLP